MAADEVLITPNNLKSNMYDNAFGNMPHLYYAVYDDLTDELIIKITQPETLVAEFPITEYYSLLVEPNTFEVVGVQLSEFTSQHLPNMKELSKVWFEKKYPEIFSTYKSINYKPKESTKEKKTDSYMFIQPERIANILVAA